MYNNMEAASESIDQAAKYNQLSKTVQFRNATKLLTFIKVKEGDRILDVGCGTGSLVKFLAEKVGSTGFVMGIDPDVERLNMARDLLLGVNNIDFCKSRSNDFPLENSKPYDGVVSNIVYHWVTDEEKIESFERVFESLKPGGTFAASFPTGFAENVLQLVDAYSTKHSQFRSQFETAVSSCMFFVSMEWLLKQLAKVGFTINAWEQDYEMYSLATPDDFVNWCQASFANTPLGKFNYRSMYEEVIEEFALQRNPKGEIDLSYPTCYFSAVKPADEI